MMFGWQKTACSSLVGFLVVLAMSSYWKGKDLVEIRQWRVQWNDKEALGTKHHESIKRSTRGRALEDIQGLTGSSLFSATSKLSTGREEYTLTMPDGSTRMYLAYIPDDLTGPPALILDYHSLWSQPGGQLWWSKTKEHASERNFIVVYPKGEGAFFNAFNSGPFSGPLYETSTIDDLGFTKAIIEEIKDNMIINPRRIYATGYSSGGAMALYAAYKLPEYIAALSVGGWALNDDTYQEVRKEKATNPNWHPMPVFGIHGYNDPVVCWEPVCFTPWQIIDWDRDGFYANAKLGWHRWANVNDCYGNAVTLSKNPGEMGDIPAHADHLWDKVYLDCDGGVEVRQILNSNNHAGEFLFPGASGFEAQPQYAERIVDFLLRWSLPDYIEVTEPAWWRNRLVTHLRVDGGD